ncbi:MAG: hypothetical protein ACE5DQ_02560 [Candidatus Paceibacterota bacterium]
MSAKSIVMLAFVIGSSVGSYLPALFGASLFSYTSVILGAVGGVIGIYVGYKLSN